MLFLEGTTLRRNVLMVLLLSLAVLIGSVTSSGADTVVVGAITSDTTWTLAGSPYIVTSTVQVYGTATTPATLTIEPGVVVKFASSGGLQIGNSTNKGALVAKGTAASRITFTRSATSNWGSVTFQAGTVNATTDLENVDIQYSSGVTMTSCSPTIRNSTITNVTGNGLYLTSASPIIDTVTVTGTGTYGIYLLSSTPTITNSAITSNGTYGIYLFNSSPIITNSTITNNGSYGIYLSSSSPTITGGSLTNSYTGGYGIYGSGSPIISNYNVSIVNRVGIYGLYLSPTTSAFAVTNSTIGNGLYISPADITPTITGNTFTNLDNSPLHAGANIIGQLIANNTITGLSSAGRIEVVGEQVNQNVTWRKLAAPYKVVSGTVSVYKDTTTAATLTLEAGATVLFSASSGLQIGTSTSKGALIAQGTTTDRITLTRSDATGNWSSITFNDGTIDATTILENVDIKYSSGITMNIASPVLRNCTLTDVNGYGLNLSSSNPTVDTVTITNSGIYGINLSTSSPIITGGSLTNTSPTGQGINGNGSPVISNYSVSIANTALKYGINLATTSSTLSITNSTIGNGLYLGSTAITPTITGNTFTNLDNSPLHAGANIIGQLIANNTITGLSSAGRIEVVGERVSQNTTWNHLVAPYVVISGPVSVYNTTTTAATLTIAAGTVVKFDYNTGLTVGSGSNRGVLIADGSSSPILLTSSKATPAPGDWPGVTLNGSASSASIINGVIIEYGGYYGGSSSTANLMLYSSSPIIRNCTIRNSLGSGIYLSYATNSPLVQNCAIYGNKWGIYSSNSNPCIVNSMIYGNSTAGVWNYTPGSTVDARGNWWGAATGPYHASNSTGTGNAVSDAVLFNPWIGQTPGSGLTFSDVKVVPTAFNPVGDYLTFTATLSASANWTITITDSTSNVVRTLTGSGTTISQQWFGDDNQSVKVADGSYTYKIEAVNPATSETASPLQGTIKVSRQVPIAILTVPADNQIYSGGTVVNVTGTAADAVDFKNYTLDYGVGDNPVSWTGLKSATTQVQNSLFSSWDLSNAIGGVYTLRLTVTDNAGNATVKTVRIRFLWIQSATLSESYISPNGDAVKDAAVISATASYPVNWTVTISNAAGAVVRTLTASGSSSISQAWDGKDSGGVVVPDGLYTYQITALDPVSSLQATPRTGAITVDSTLPTALITAPTSGAAIQNTLTIIGTAVDTNFDNYKVEYGPASGSGPWTQLTTSTTPATASNLAVLITNDLANTVLLQNGTYMLKLTVTDRAGNASIATLPVTVDNITLSSISASQHTLNTNAGETNNISFTINRPGTVTLNIIPERSGPTGAPVYQTSINCPAAGPYSISWNGTGSTGNVVPDEAYLYILNATDGTRADSYNPPAPTGVGSVTSSQGAYYPRRNVPLTIRYSVTQAERVDIKISWGSQNFKIMDGVPHFPGSYTYEWDGRNPAGTMLNGGGTARCSAPSLLAENVIITTGNTPTVTDVKADPYQVQLSYGQFTRVKYAISKPAKITIKLLPPTSAGITLVDNVLQAAGQYVVEWDPSVSTGSGIAVSDEGDYTVWVQAKDPVTGASSLTRGNLSVGN